MPEALIKLAFKQTIDIHAVTPVAQEIFHKSYAEFQVQQQSFSKGQPLYTWTEIKNAFPKAHPALPYKVSFSISGTMQRLGGKIPGLTDVLGTQEIPYAQYVFELVESDTRDRGAHLVNLVFVTGELTLFRVIGNQLLLSLDGEPSTLLLKMQPGLSIVRYVE